MFGPKFQAWQDKNANLVDGLGALGVGLSQWDAGQPVDMIGAWDSIQNRRAQRKFGEAMRDPALLAGFTPEQKSMLAQMPAQMAQQLIMEKVFAPPPAPVKPNYDYIDGFGVVDMNNPPADMMAGNFKPAPGPAPMSQADRDFWGIPKDDPRAWVIGKDGKPEAIGDLPKPADMPTSVDEYNFYKADQEAKGLPVLSYNEWDMQGKKAGATTVNNTVDTGSDVGTIPQGWELFTDPKTGARTMRPIAGGPEDPAKVDAAKASGTAIASQVITTAADRALEANKNRMVDGLAGYVASFNPESQNAEVYRQVAVLTANAKVENLQAMRNESPTGGALGSVTKDETKMLADQAGALDPASQNFERDLLDYTRTLLQVVHGKQAGDALFEQKYGAAAASGQSGSAQNAGTTKSGLKWSVAP